MLKKLLTGLFTFSCALGASISAHGAEAINALLSAGNHIRSTLSDNSVHQKISLHQGDVFRGRAELAKIVHNPAQMTLYIRKTTSRDDDNSEIDIEAVAVMKISDTHAVYGLQGTYVPEWGQLELYEVREIETMAISPPGGRLINGEVFEPVGLAGRMSEDNQKIYCHIAYNGNAVLIRLQDGADVFPLVLSDRLPPVFQKDPESNH